MAKQQVTGRTKVKPDKVFSDDCEVTVGAETFRPHVGEWVEVIPGLALGESRAVLQLQEAYVAAQAADTDQEKQVAARKIMDLSFDGVCKTLARRVRRWNWTWYDRDEAMPQPDGTPEFFAQLSDGEMFWLLRAVQGQTESQRGNSRRPSPTTSSATG